MPAGSFLAQDSHTIAFIVGGGVAGPAGSLETRPADYRGETVRLYRPPLEVAWTETRFTEPLYGPLEGKEVCTRMCVARADCTQAVILLDYRPGSESAVDGAWKTLLETLVVGEYIEDAKSGRRHAKRG